MLLSQQMLEVVELTRLRDATVGTPGVNGLSVEQRKVGGLAGHWSGQAARRGLVGCLAGRTADPSARSGPLLTPPPPPGLLPIL